MKATQNLSVLLTLAFSVLFSSSTLAFERGDVLVRVGTHTVMPKSNSGEIAALSAGVQVEDATSLTFDFTYMVSNHLGFELLAAAPFEHDIEIGGDNLASTKHLPPSVSALYYFNPESRVKFYAGLGLNVTLFFEEKTRGAIDAAELELDTSIGAVGTLGVDLSLNNGWFLNADVRYFDIDTDATVKLPGGVRLNERVEIDPWAIGANIGYRF